MTKHGDIKEETARSIALAYREIEVAEKLLVDVQNKLSEPPTDIRDDFGRPVTGLRLGVPSSTTSRTLFDVPWSLAEPIIRSHIDSKRRLIRLLSRQALAEMSDEPKGCRDD